ncbi:MAG: hypothetical protein IPI49_19250 [Myxococcales bacterium]|nr:hypothetical protein [Myxococcales bacterium]
MRKIYKRSKRAELVAAVQRGEPVPECSATAQGDRIDGVYMGAEVEGRTRLGISEDADVRRVGDGRAASTALVVRVGAAEIELRVGFDAGLLRAVVAALDGGAP